MKNKNIFNDTDKKTLEWIHGEGYENRDVNVQLSIGDSVHLLELMLLYLFDLMLGINLPGACTTGDEQPLTWRWINLFFIKPGAMSREEVRERFIMHCEGIGFEDDPELLSLFDTYIVPDKLIDGYMK